MLVQLVLWGILPAFAVLSVLFISAINLQYTFLGRAGSPSEDVGVDGVELEGVDGEESGEYTLSSKRRREGGGDTIGDKTTGGDLGSIPPVLLLGEKLVGITGVGGEPNCNKFPHSHPTHPDSTSPLPPASHNPQQPSANIYK